MHCSDRRMNVWWLLISYRRAPWNHRKSGNRQTLNGAVSSLISRPFHCRAACRYTESNNNGANERINKNRTWFLVSHRIGHKQESLVHWDLLGSLLRQSTVSLTILSLRNALPASSSNHWLVSHSAILVKLGFWVIIIEYETCMYVCMYETHAMPN